MLSGLGVAALVVAVIAAFILTVRGSVSDADAGRAGTTRTYYIAADPVLWNYAPEGYNLITGAPFDDVAAVFTTAGPNRIGSTYLKSLFQEYTDATFTTPAPRPAAWQHLGFLGPVIHAAVGDTVRIVFRNNLDRAASIHMHGLRYDKASEGAPYNDGTVPAQRADDAVPPGATYSYTYTVPERAGPGPMDPSSVMWMYHSHVDEVGDTNSGLMGPVIVTARNKARADGTPKDVDRELVGVFQVTDENESLDLPSNVEELEESPLEEDEEFVESNLMHNVNGYVFGNQPLGTSPGEGMTVKAGQRVRWYLMSMGTEVDLHTPHWHGNTVLFHGLRQDVVELLPATTLVADMKPDDPGTWLYHCHVNDHIIAGMLALYRVNP